MTDAALFLGSVGVLFAVALAVSMVILMALVDVMELWATS